MKPDLSTLPRYIIRVNRRWWRDTNSGKWIPEANITDYLPKTPVSDQLIQEKRWDLKY